MSEDGKYVRFPSSSPVVRQYWSDLKQRKPRGAGLHINDLVYLAIRLEKHGLNVSDGSISDEDIAIVSELLKVIQVRHLLSQESLKDGLFKAAVNSGVNMNGAPISATHSENQGAKSASRDASMSEQSGQDSAQREVKGDSSGKNPPKLVEQVKLGDAAGALHMSG